MHPPSVTTSIRRIHGCVVAAAGQVGTIQFRRETDDSCAAALATAGAARTVAKGAAYGPRPVDGVLWGIQAAAKAVKRKQKGKIISASSIAGHEGFAMLGDQVCRPRADTRGCEGARWRRHHCERLLPRPSSGPTCGWRSTSDSPSSPAPIGATYKKYVEGIDAPRERRRWCP